MYCVSLQFAGCQQQPHLFWGGGGGKDRYFFLVFLLFFFPLPLLIVMNKHTRVFCLSAFLFLPLIVFSAKSKDCPFKNAGTIRLHAEKHADKMGIEEEGGGVRPAIGRILLVALRNSFTFCSKKKKIYWLGKKSRPWSEGEARRASSDR